MIRRVLLAVVAIGVPLRAAVADHCNAVLPYSYDKDYSSDKIQIYRSSKIEACSSYDKSSTKDQSLAGVYADESLHVGNDAADKEIRAWCSSDDEVLSLKNDFQSRIDKVHDSVIAAWLKCEDTDGVHTSLIYTDDPKILFLHTKFVGSRPGEDIAVVKGYRPLNLNCDGFRIGERIAKVQNYTCFRDPTKPSSITIRVKDYGSPDSISVRSSPQPIKPKYDITGWRKGDPGDNESVLTVREADNVVTWEYDNKDARHTFRGNYYSSTGLIGQESRVERGTNCLAILDIDMTMFGNQHTAHFERVDPKSPSACGIPGGYSYGNYITEYYNSNAKPK